MMAEIMRGFWRNLLLIGGGYGIAEGCALATGANPVPGDLAGIACGFAAALLAYPSVREGALRCVLRRPRRTVTPEGYRRLRELEAELGWEPSEIPEGMTAPAPARPRKEPAQKSDYARAAKPAEPPRAVTLPVTGMTAIADFQRDITRLYADLGPPPRRARGKSPEAVAAEHFAALARVGLEHCASYCPICLHRLFGPVPDGWPTASLKQWLEENWGWKR